MSPASRNEFDDDPPTVVDRPVFVPASRGAPPSTNSAVTTPFTKLQLFWAQLLPSFTEAFSSALIMLFFLLGWIWAWLSDG